MSDINFLYNVISISNLFSIDPSEVFIEIKLNFIDPSEVFIDPIDLQVRIQCLHTRSITGYNDNNNL